MKKLLLISLLILACIGLFAQARTYTQKVTLSDGSDPVITNTSNDSTAPDYIIETYLASADGTPLGFNMSTDPTSPSYTQPLNLRIKQFSTTNLNKVVQVNILAFNAFAQTTQYNGLRVYVRAIYTGGTSNEVGDWWYSVVPTTTNWNILTPAQIIPPFPAADTWTYNLTLNGPVGTQVTGPDAVVHTLPVVLTDNDDDINELIGLYTAAAAPEGFHWAVNPIEVVAGDFTAAKTDYVYNATKTFELVANPDTYNYTLNVNGPAGYAVAGPVAGMLPYMATDDVVGDLVGMYTVAEAPAGWHWAVNPIEVTADMFQLVTKGAAFGSRNTGAKVHYEYAKTITFELVENPPVFDYPEGTPVVVVIGTVTVTGGNGNDVPAGSVPPIPNGAFVPEFQNVMQLLGAGPWTITFNTTQPWGAWYSYTSAAWMVVPNVGGMITFVIPAGGKDIPEVPMVFGPVDPTLPVELSSFNAVLTAENFVKLTWTSESETNMLGYRVYRAEADDYAAATLITPVMIEATNSSTHQAYSITDNEVAINTTYYYWLEAVDMSHSVLYGPNAILVTGNVTPNIPTVTTLGNAYPNPFRNQTSIALEVKENETATVTIYNILGQVVKTYNKGQGSHTINWDGKDARGNACGSGIYFYRLTSPSMNQTKKMVIVK